MRTRVLTISTTQAQPWGLFVLPDRREVTSKLSQTLRTPSHGRASIKAAAGMCAVHVVLPVSRLPPAPWQHLLGRDSPPSAPVRSRLHIRESKNNSKQPCTDSLHAMHLRNRGPTQQCSSPDSAILG
jgi:hypothetical protein